MSGNREETVKWTIHKYGGGTFTEIDDEIAAELPLTIRLDGEEFATIVCTPSDLTDMTIGFLASEAVIRRMDDIAGLRLDESRGFVDVELTRKQSIGKDYYAKRFIGSCCGKSRQFYFHNDVRTAKTVMTRLQISPEQCFDLMAKLQNGSAGFQRTGGLHNAGLCTPDELLAARTDIGRHNALDKIFGHMLRNGIPAADKALAFSGRISSEVVLKTAKIGAGILLSKSAPTDLALELAHDLGITAVGFIRSGSMNVYTHPERIVAKL
ncbi:formate dehydrogenase accessory sulfurtransferase FdhD [Paenibacillus contaminans]|uniref:Sulfur carrier protein FdhD n=1 Tax=Paenibacillus contaminans TaxID=450362 RepID=A0A329LXU6_9BACL|nr:formate dehydrogenase accessory sulfurtransferase FdhD [Paenibacillus contaminans]RAV12681.1 formate dehydrogenase accessory sulfurtransferase FdhD [Paenibacillus contaminans]